jgi:hypothetical protein
MVEQSEIVALLQKAAGTIRVATVVSRQLSHGRDDLLTFADKGEAVLKEIEAVLAKLEAASSGRDQARTSAKRGSNYGK